MVAKSYANLAQLCEPYSANGRLYVKVRMPNGLVKQVRWYSEVEYNRMYPSDVAKKTTPQKNALGFQKGYITIFQGNTYPHLEYFKRSNARYCKLWGWYVVSTEELPSNLPTDVIPVQLSWDLVGYEDGNLRPDSEIVSVIDSLRSPVDPSNFQGTIGGKITVTATVKRKIALNGYYGPSNMYIMRDSNENCYVWCTAAKDWEVESTHTFKATIKDHRVYRNTRQTILTRCYESRK